MKIIDLLHIAEKVAQDYRPQAIESIKRNTHLHDCEPEDIGAQDFVDAILADFINFLAYQHGVDYGIHAYDIYWPEARDQYNRICELYDRDLVFAEKAMADWENKKEKHRREILS